jgi:hypothetical protein
VRAEFFHADGRTDRQTVRTKLIVTFCNTPNMKKIFWNSHAKVISLQATCLKKKGEGRNEMKIKFMPNAFSTTHTKERILL